jgi:hypothetical protein
VRRTLLARTQLGVGLIFVATFVAFGAWARLPVPYRDDWDWLLARLAGPVSLRSLFNPHNEHLIPLPRLLFAVQYRLEGGDGYLLFATALLSQLITGFVVWRETRRRWSDADIVRAFVTGVACVFLFFTFQLQSFVFPAAVLFPLVQMFATVAFACTLTAGESPGWRRVAWLLGAAIATLGAALTTTNGLVVPSVLAFLTWARRGSRTAVAALAALQMSFLAGYVMLVGRPWLHAPPPAGAAWSIPSLRELTEFFLAFFGSGLAYGSVSAAEAVGLALFALGCYAVCSVALDRSEAPRIEHLSAALMIFSMLSAAMMTPARAQFGAIQAAQSRYATYAMAYWTGLMLWTVSRLASRPTWHRMQIGIMVPAIVISCAMLVADVFIGLVWKAKADNIAVAGLAVRLDVPDDEWIATLHPVTSVVYQAADRLRAAHDPGTTHPLIGTRVDMPETVPVCDGVLTLTSVGPNAGWRVGGTLNAPDVAFGVVVDRMQLVRGVARAAPLVAAPNPTEPEIVRTVWSSLGRRRPSPRPWLGFSQSGAGPPYTLYVAGPSGDVADPSGHVPCRASLITGEPIHVWLDAPMGVVAGTAPGGGWALQCGGSIDRVSLVVDDVEQPVRVARNSPRPDVRAAFAGHCQVTESPGFSFVLDTTALSPGTHQVKARASDAHGATVDSKANAIIVKPRP